MGIQLMCIVDRAMGYIKTGRYLSTRDYKSIGKSEGTRGGLNGCLLMGINTSG